MRKAKCQDHWTQEQVDRYVEKSVQEERDRLMVIFEHAYKSKNPKVMREIIRLWKAEAIRKRGERDERRMGIK